jgi:hypothetical protein
LWLPSSNQVLLVSDKGNADAEPIHQPTMAGANKTVCITFRQK